MSRVRLDCYKRDNRTKWERENNIFDLRTQAKNTLNFETKKFLNPHISRKPEATFTNPKYFDISERLPEGKSVKPLPAHLKFPQHTLRHVKKIWFSANQACAGLKRLGYVSIYPKKNFKSIAGLEP